MHACMSCGSLTRAHPAALPKIFDVDLSSTLSLSELTQMVLRGQRASLHNHITITIGRVWEEVAEQQRAAALREQKETGDYWTASSSSVRGGMRKEDILAACKESPSVRRAREAYARPASIPIRCPRLRRSLHHLPSPSSPAPT